MDELRIWQGSDFNVEAAITELVEQQRTALTQLLTEVSPLKPLLRNGITTKRGLSGILNSVMGRHNGMGKVNLL
ncbi:hypothetical protein [Picosynechococcus sp. PCC 11901]|uniref:hypothetical protein n=1 Tax=Picosynechococcus sp. PCC 11901 TaxID=2579791 RepID=UPI0015E87FC5|nr:hypothetical protein [Picosynechococcus sp. PCC 11901]